MSVVIEANDANFENEVIGNAEPVLVDFSAAWCAPCKKLEPIVDEIAGEYQGRLKVVKVNVDSSPNTAAKFSVMSVPTLLFFKAGQVQDQVIGVVSKQALADRVEKVI